MMNPVLILIAHICAGACILGNIGLGLYVVYRVYLKKKETK